MQVLAKIVRIDSLVGLDVVIQNDYPDIAVFSLKWLDNKWEKRDAAAYMVEKIFNVVEQMNAKAAILAVLFQDDLRIIESSVQRGGEKQRIDVKDCQSVRQHEVAEYSGLESLRSARQLRCCGGDEPYTPLDKIGQQVLFSGIEPDTAVDDVVCFELIICGEKSLIVPDDSERTFQKIISENR